jgi:hypothetical protein
MDEQALRAAIDPLLGAQNTARAAR